MDQPVLLTIRQTTDPTALHMTYSKFAVNMIAVARHNEACKKFVAAIAKDGPDHPDAKAWATEMDNLGPGACIAIKALSTCRWPTE